MKIAAIGGPSIARQALKEMLADKKQAKRMEQCFNCENLKNCDPDDSFEDENGFCKYCKPFVQKTEKKVFKNRFKDMLEEAMKDENI